MKRRSSLEECAEALEAAVAVLEIAESLKHPKHASKLAPIRKAARIPLARYFRKQGRLTLKAISAHLKHVADNNKNVKEANSDADAKQAISYALPDGYQLPLSLTSGMSADYSKSLTAAMTAGYDVLAADNGADIEIAGDVVEQYLRDHSLEKVTGDLNRTSVDKLRSALADAYKSGADYEELVQTVKDEFADFSDVRTGLIAQTEMNNAYNQGRKQLGLDLGFNEKSWSADGPNPCPECIGNVLDGWIPMDAVFSSGDFEPTAHPGCFCSLDLRSNPQAANQ